MLSLPISLVSVQNLPNRTLRAAAAAPLPSRFGFWMARAAVPTIRIAGTQPQDDLRDLDQRVRESGEW